MAGSTRERKSVAGIEVANFGPIVEADIDLRPLTVFVGSSNTGKSYLAMLIYALHQFASDSRFLHGFRRAHRAEPLRDIHVKGLGPFLLGWLEDVSLAGRPMAGHLPARVSVAVRNVLDEPKPLANGLGEGIASSFGFPDLGHLVRHGTQNSATVAWRAGAAGGPVSRYSYKIKRNGKSTLTGEVPPGLNLQVPSPRIDRSLWLLRRCADAGEFSESYVRLVLGDIADLAFYSTVGQFNRRAHYLPADRTGIMHAHSMVRSLIGQASHAGIRRQVELPMLSGVLADFLENLIDLPSSKSRYAELVEVMEFDLLGGSVESTKPDAGYPSFWYLPNGCTNGLPLMNASSMVSELAPLALYLRHVVKPGELLIIEEPESHLHPEMQVRLARFLARVAKRGLRLLVTTHSETFLEALGNVIVLDGIPEAERSRIPGNDSTIPQDDVGVWLFGHDTDARGSHVREVELDVESGTFPTQFELVNEALYNDWASTHDRSNGWRLHPPSRTSSRTPVISQRTRATGITPEA